MLLWMHTIFYNSDPKHKERGVELFVSGWWVLGEQGCLPTPEAAGLMLPHWDVQPTKSSIRHQIDILFRYAG